MYMFSYMFSSKCELVLLTTYVICTDRFGKICVMPKIDRSLKLFLTLLIWFACMFTIVKAGEIESNNFKIEGDDLSAGSSSGSSSNYGLVGDVNPFSDQSASTNFKQEVGYSPRLRANTPRPPTLQNSEQYYDRLLIIIDDSDNPSDTLYAVAISDDDFSTYQYVQSDGTVGDTLGIEDYRNYVSWGGVSGSFILGLDQSTAYKVRAKALHGDFTETGYSSDSNEVSTTVPFVNLSLSSPGLTLGTLNANSVSTTTSTSVTVNTNAYSGYQVYVSDQGDGASGGLYDGASSLIESNDQSLIAGFEGYGVQASSGSASIDTKYDVSGDNVGGLEVSNNGLFSNTAAVSGESADVLFKATMAPSTIAGEYTDVVYFTVTPNL